MLKTFKRLATTLAMCTCAAYFSASHSQPLSPGKTSTTFSLTGINQFSTGLDQGGNFNWYETDARLRMTRQFSSEWAAGFSVGYGYDRWFWNDAKAFGGQAPWGSISTPSIGLSFQYTPQPGLTFAFNPSIEWAGEDGVGKAGSSIYGAVISAANRFNNKLTLGIGAGVFRELGETKVFPYLVVNWKITDKLTLRNPLPAGPAGGAGLELAYAIDNQWSVGVGGAYRKYRFRLNDSGPYAGGVGQNRMIPVFARLSYAFTPSTALDFYASAVTGGIVQAQSADGSRSKSVGYNTGLGLALNLSHRF
jgi:hypothetical protein